MTTGLYPLKYFVISPFILLQSCKSRYKNKDTKFLVIIALNFRLNPTHIQIWGNVEIFLGASINYVNRALRIFYPVPNYSPVQFLELSLIFDWHPLPLACQRSLCMLDTLTNMAFMISSKSIQCASKISHDLEIDRPGICIKMSNILTRCRHAKIKTKSKNMPFYIDVQQQN